MHCSECTTGFTAHGAGWEKNNYNPTLWTWLPVTSRQTERAIKSKYVLPHPKSWISAHFLSSSSHESVYPFFHHQVMNQCTLSFIKSWISALPSHESVYLTSYITLCIHLESLIYNLKFVWIETSTLNIVHYKGEVQILSAQLRYDISGVSNSI